VTGLATSTRAGIELVEKLCGIEAMNVLDRSSLPRLRSLLDEKLDLWRLTDIRDKRAGHL
jgi:hypothetical protein